MPTDALRRRTLLTVLGTAVVVGIFFLLFGFGSTPGSGNLLPNPWDKGVHIAVFAILAIGLRMLMPGLPGWVLFGLAIVIALADELHQLWVPTRQPDWNDGIADLLGAALGLTLWANLLK
ncbi:VanZ family protein [Dechloromonas sp. ARDL1]|uniref:VanZ family protein n=1 Tax=Dechloromonas sp. ARDL1 TaxID=3322121 RepID=UPI003DA75B48